MTGAFLVLVGPDGVGKTTVARAVIAERAGRASYFHFMPRLLHPLEAGPPAVPGQQPDKGRPGGSRVLGWLRLTRNVARAWLSYWVRIRPAVRRGRLVVGDRWLYGYVAQPLAMRFHGPAALALLATRALPQPDLVVNLQAPPAVIHDRKQELSPEQIAVELDRWQAVPAAHKTTVDARESPREIARRILEAL